MLVPEHVLHRVLDQDGALVEHRHLVGDGLDELALHGESQIIDLEHGDMRRLTVTPADFGLPAYPLSAIEGGEPDENRKMVEAALAGEGSEAHRAAIAMNCGALLKLTDNAASFKDGAEMAMESMRQAKPLSILTQVADISHQEPATNE